MKELPFLARPSRAHSCPARSSASTYHIFTLRTAAPYLRKPVPGRRIWHGCVVARSEAEQPRRNHQGRLPRRPLFGQHQSCWPPRRRPLQARPQLRGLDGRAWLPLSPRHYVLGNRGENRRIGGSGDRRIGRSADRAIGGSGDRSKFKEPSLRAKSRLDPRAKPPRNGKPRETATVEGRPATPDLAE